ncbi:hypothetical protein D9981_15845 [Pseudoalteromonas phenolica O-BC30]|nr:hypothetical protein D9981_15845 [Pseudoalteromonas phenolica O-BC30]
MFAYWPPVAKKVNLKRVTTKLKCNEITKANINSRSNLLNSVRHRGNNEHSNIKQPLKKVSQSQAHLTQKELITAFNLAAEAKQLDNSMAADTILKQILSDDVLQKLVKSTHTLLNKHSALISQGQRLLNEAPIEWNIIELNEFLFQLNSLIQNSEKAIALTPWQHKDQAYHLITLNTQYIEQLKLLQQQLLNRVKTATCDALCAGLKANLKDAQKNIKLFDEVAVESMMAFPFEQQLKKIKRMVRTKQ